MSLEPPETLDPWPSGTVTIESWTGGFPRNTTYIHAELESDGTDYRLKCVCGAYMVPTWGKRTDEIPPRDYMWHVCEDEPTHITEPIQVSPAFRSAFTKTF